MEDVLDLYSEDYDPRYPTVCLDEKPVVLHAETRPIQPAAPGRPERRDYEYVRQGTANLFVLVEPLAGWRHVTVTARRTKADYAAQLRYLADEVYSQAEYIRLVQDNLNTHALAALYEVFAPAEARRLASRFEVHYTPKHASWLNMAEIEISVFQRGCLSRPVGDAPTLHRRVSALERERNAARCTIQWQFTSQQARSTLANLYPIPSHPIPATPLAVTSTECQNSIGAPLAGYRWPKRKYSSWCHSRHHLSSSGRTLTSSEAG